jgi:signal transduction histidine kinase
MGDHLSHASVLIVSDDTEFARSVAARWHTERHVPEITLVTSDVWHGSSAASYDLAILGPMRDRKTSAILSALRSYPNVTAVCVSDDEKEISFLQSEYPNVQVVPRHDGWTSTLILVASEALRRVQAVARAQRAERLAIENQAHAALGRYILEMRPSVNNALTSILGNADLLLLEPGEVTAECRDQIRTVHTMALRLHEIMQRFSSLAAEMRAGEKESQADTAEDSHHLASGAYANQK